MLSLTKPHLLLGLLGCGSLLALGCTGSIGEGPGSPGDETPAGPTGVSDPGTSAPGGGGQTPGGGSGSAPQVAGDAPRTCAVDQVGKSPLHRLTRLEYDNTVRDLTGEDMQLGKAFAFDERAGEFTANFFTPIGEMEFAQYATAAEAVAEKAAANLSKFMSCDPAADAAGCSTTFIKQFGRRAYRRPLDDEETASFQKLFDMGRTGADFANGVRLVVQAMLQSPKFLYLLEGPDPLTQHQMAARLSYFLWNAPPDAQLSAAADAGQLGSMSGLHEHTVRMLADPRALDMMNDFHTQWLGLEELPTETKDAKLYPDFDGLKGFMIEENSRFVTDVMKNGGNLEALFTAPYTFVNGPLATLYGAGAGGSATDWKKVDLDPKQRAGIFTQGGFLAAHGSFDASSPILRGLAIRERFLCAPMPVPPPGADQNFPMATPSTTTRQRFDKHRTDPTCASCHVLMDKIGYGFESYDAIGRFRTTENGVTVDDSGEMLGTGDIDGPFKGASELAHKLSTSKQVQQCVTTQWFRYAMGRLDTDLDKCVLDSLVKRFGDSGFKVSDLLTAIVESDAFRTYRPLN